MNTILLLCQCDSIVTKACGALIPVVRESYEAGTNCSDVCIADVICRSSVIIVAILVAGFLAWKLIDRISAGISGWNKRIWDVADKNRKQESDLIDKLLDFLKSKATGKDNNNVQQTNNKGLSWSSEDIYKLLKENAANSCSEELREKYIELCVKLLQKLKTNEDNPSGGDNSDAGKCSNDTSDEQSPTLSAQPTHSSASKGNSTPSNNVQTYTGVLCTLLGLFHKNQLEKTDIQALKKSCGLPKDEE